MPTAICLGCGVRVFDDAPCACERIARDPYRSADAAPRARACPRCGRALIEIEYGGTDLEECTACGGVWLEPWIMDRLVAAREARLSLSIALPVREVAGERVIRYLRCPRCSAQMNRKIYGPGSGVVVDVCKDDGIWFDAGELAAILDFVESGGLERARRRAAEQRESEARKARSRGLAPPPLLERETTSLDLGFDLLRALAEWWKR